MHAVADPFAALTDEERGLLRAAPRPDWVEPMKAVLTDERFSRRRLGLRAQVRRHPLPRVQGGRDRCGCDRATTSASTARFPEIAAALEADPVGDVVLDGEVVAFAGSQTSFARLQQRGERAVRSSSTSSTCCTSRGTTRPRCRCARASGCCAHLRLDDPIRLATHRNRDGEAYYRHACEQGWEGLIAKRADAPYTHGRSRDWLKFKCSAEQELVIGGWTAPRGSRTDLGALLLGYYDDDRLRYAGQGRHRLHAGHPARPGRAAGAAAPRRARRSPTSCA